MHHASSPVKAFKRAPSLECSKWYMGSLTTNLAETHETNGAFCLVEATLVPGNEPPPHVHSREDELFYVLEGEFDVYVGAEAFKVETGACIFLPKGPPHAFVIRSPRLRLLTLFTPGGRLAAEALATVLAVPLLRQVLAPRRPAHGRDGALPPGTLRAVVDDIEAHLETDLTLAQLAAAAHLSAYHFARQFKTATGVPPHQYVLARRVARAQALLHPDRDLALAEIAARVGFADHSQFAHHFKRVVGVTPRQFLTSASIA
jgi:AraC-like DNA-binding protein/mannose-6-phosphate isomerase-like protein (cupin superfamily)